MKISNINEVTIKITILYPFVFILSRLKGTIKGINYHSREIADTFNSIMLYKFLIQFNSNPVTPFPYLNIVHEAMTLWEEPTAE